MSIHFISGKPGGGKSLYGMRLIVQELVHGTRPIYTNVPILEGNLRMYLADKYPAWYIGATNLWERIRMLTDEETQRFWCHRPGHDVEFLGQGQEGKERWRNGQKPSYAGVKDKGVFFVIDEVHNFFGSRQWQDTGQDVLFYLSQHRKLGDTVICITQAVGNVDKQFRSVTQDFTYLRNLGKEKYGRFRLPSMFVRRTFSSPPSDATKASDAMESGTFTLDVSGLASCYNTAAGVGIHAKIADTGERKSGLHWSVGVSLVILAVLLVGVSVPNVVAAFFKTPTVKVQKKSENQIAQHQGSSQATYGAEKQRDTGLSETTVTSKIVAGEAETNYCKGYIYIPGSKDCKVFMSDGRQLSLRKGEVQAIHETYILAEGRRYLIKSESPAAK